MIRDWHHLFPIGFVLQFTQLQIYGHSWKSTRLSVPGDIFKFLKFNSRRQVHPVGTNHGSLLATWTRDLEIGWKVDPMLDLVQCLSARSRRWGWQAKHIWKPLQQRRIWSFQSQCFDGQSRHLLILLAHLAPVFQSLWNLFLNTKWLRNGKNAAAATIRFNSGGLLGIWDRTTRCRRPHLVGWR